MSTPTSDDDSYQPSTPEDPQHTTVEVDTTVDVQPALDPEATAHDPGEEYADHGGGDEDEDLSRDDPVEEEPSDAEDK